MVNGRRTPRCSSGLPTILVCSLCSFRLFFSAMEVFLPIGIQISFVMGKESYQRPMSQCSEKIISASSCLFSASFLMFLFLFIVLPCPPCPIVLLFFQPHSSTRLQVWEDQQVLPTEAWSPTSHPPVAHHRQIRPAPEDGHNYKKRFKPLLKLVQIKKSVYFFIQILSSHGRGKIEFFLYSLYKMILQNHHINSACN